MPATRAARMVSAPSASTWTISASMPAKPSPSRGRATMFSGRMPSSDRRPRRQRRTARGGKLDDRLAEPDRAAAPLAGGARRQQVHRRIAEERRHEGVGGTPVDLERRAHLHDLAAVHDADAVAQRHGLDLVVGDVDHGGAEPAVQPADLAARRDAQRRIEIGQRLVEQEHLGVAHDGPPERHALALAAGERVRLAIEKAREPERAGHRRHAPLDLGAAAPTGGAARRPGCRPRSCAGRAHRTGTPWRCRGPWPAHGLTSRPSMESVPDEIELQAGDHPERRGLAAPRRPEQHHELAVARPRARRRRPRAHGRGRRSWSACRASPPPLPRIPHFSAPAVMPWISRSEKKA